MAMVYLFCKAAGGEDTAIAKAYAHAFSAKTVNKLDRRLTSGDSQKQLCLRTTLLVLGMAKACNSCGLI